MNIKNFKNYARTCNENVRSKNNGGMPHFSQRLPKQKKTKPTIDRELGELQCEYQSTMTRKVSSSKPAGLARIVSQCSWRVATRAS